VVTHGGGPLALAVLAHRVPRRARDFPMKFPLLAVMVSALVCHFVPTRHDFVTFRPMSRHVRPPRVRSNRVR
jgi:hypothetical protein